MYEEIFKNKKILLTGHTGFKGSWMCNWLSRYPCEIMGIALPPSTNPSLFKELKLDKKIHYNHFEDIRNSEKMDELIINFKPDFVFHLAAQPLVRYSYLNPIDNYNTNIFGLINILESFKKYDNDAKIVVVTTDKCYENKEWSFAYRENDSLGGHDPYSASKACAEIITKSYFLSFFQNQSETKIATVRAGNVIGGGDWATDRIIPDAVRAYSKSEKLIIRNPYATRPWQHVLEPISGYMATAGFLRDNDSYDSFNFGPTVESIKNVDVLLKELSRHINLLWQVQDDSKNMKEASNLALTIDKAWNVLKWKPKWSFEKTIEKTALWYKEFYKGESAVRITDDDIDDFFTQ